MVHGKLCIQQHPVYTASNGAPVKNPEASMRIGDIGPLLLQDFHLIDQLAHFDRERIPERVVHAKGTGAYGYFETTHSLADICSIDMYSEVGKKTDLVVRFSTVAGEKGSADTARDPRGFSTKFYTNEGNWDWVFNDTPIFFIRDPTLFPLLIHSQKRNPQTNLRDASAFWDYLSTHQESVHQVMHTFSDRGTPLTYRHMNAYSANTFKFTKPDGSFKYIKIHTLSDQGVENLSNDEAHMLAIDDPDWNTRDLFESIEASEYSTWTVYVQVMDPADAPTYHWNVFDMTKVWPHKDYPLRQVGKITLNRNPLHAFNPFQRDGPMNVNGNLGARPNYPSTFRPVNHRNIEASQRREMWSGPVISTQWEITDEDYVQADGFWQVLGQTAGQQDAFVYNVSSHLKNARVEVRRQTYNMFTRVNPDLGKKIEAATEKAASAPGPKSRLHARAAEAAVAVVNLYFFHGRGCINP